MQELPQKGDRKPFVSVVIPVKNGQGRLEHCLSSLARQAYPADRFEVIVADGGSTDDTAEIARSFEARVVDNERQIVASGRNAGVRASRGDYVAFTDDDCVLPEDWLSNGVETLEATGADGLGGPTPIPADSPPFSRAVNLVFRWASKTAGSVQSDVVSEASVEDLPGGNAIYRRESLRRVGPVDERLVTAEDVELHRRMRSLGMELRFSPAFTALHCKRDDPRRFFRQIRRFAVGRVQAERLAPGCMTTSHRLAAWVAPLALVALVASGWILGLAAGAASLLALWGLSIVIALLAGEGWRAAPLFGPALGLFFLAWSWGVASETLFPMADAAGR